MPISPYVVLPVLSMVFALAAAIIFGDGTGNVAWAMQTFPPMCGF